MRIITVDLGASSGRVIVAKVVEGKIVLEEMNRFYHSIIDRDGTLSWDIEFIYRNVEEGIDKTTKEVLSVLSKENHIPVLAFSS